MKINLIILIFLINFIFSFQNDIYWNQTQILIANDGKEKDYFGSVVRIKGNISVIGAFWANIGNNSLQGKAYIFQNNGTNWNQKQILIANDGEAGDYFGISIAISNDEKYILIGAPNLNVGNNSHQGKAYIFENNGTFYNQKQLLVPNDGEESDQFGWSISISNDSSFIAIGAYNAKIGENISQGKVYIFQNNGTFWNQKEILLANDGKENDGFGSSVVISNDSSLILIGAPHADLGKIFREGKAYIFQNNGTNWNQKQILTSSDGKGSDNFGSRISISQNFLVISSPEAFVNNTFQGKVYIFQNNGTFWNQIQILTANDQKNNDFFGFSVSISNDEKFILIGAPQSFIGENAKGKVYIFQNNGTFYNLFQILFANDEKDDDQFGYSASISNDFVLIGSPYSSFGNNISQGKAYIFDLDSNPNPNPNSNYNSKTKTIYLIIIVFFILIGIFLIIFLIRKTKQKQKQIQKQIQNQNQEEEILMNSSLFSDENENENDQN